MSVSINGTSGLVFNDASTQATAATGFGFKNRILNGGMVLDQRNAGASVAANNVYSLDRWLVLSDTSNKWTVQQNSGSVTPPVGFKYYLGAVSSSAYTPISTDYFGPQQRIEGFNVADLEWGTANASPITISFWVRSSLTGTFGGAILNDGQNRNYPFSYTISSANTWEYKTVTIAGDTTGAWLTTNGSGLKLFFSLGAGSSRVGTAGAWTGTSNVFAPSGAVNVVSTNGATWYVTGVQLEKGSTATSFDYRPYGTELNLCQRYFQYANSSQAATASGGETSCICALGVKVDMRATPSVVSVSALFHRPGIAFYAASSPSGTPNSTGDGYTAFAITAGAGANTSGQIIGVIQLVAEL
jgi:hypothetical protein